MRWRAFPVEFTRDSMSTKHADRNRRQPEVQGCGESAGRKRGWLQGSDRKSLNGVSADGRLRVLFTAETRQSPADGFAQH